MRDNETMMQSRAIDNDDGAGGRNEERGMRNG